MKKTISKSLVLLLVFVLTMVCLVSCGEQHTHSFVEGTCSCGEKDPNYVPPHTHSHTSEQTKIPSCTEVGEMTFTCSCGDSYTEEIAMSAHNYVDGACDACGAKDPGAPEEITLVASKTQAYRNETIVLSALFDGKVSNDAAYTITEGDDIATLLGNMISIGASAKAGDVIKVQASFKGVISNEITISIIASPDEQYFLTLSSDTITVDKYAASASFISVVVRNYNFQTVNVPLTYTVVEGDAGIVELENRGNTCGLVAKGHGQVTIQVAIPETDVAENVVVNVIVPPGSISIPEVFEQRRSFAYKFSLRDALPFAVGIQEENVATAYKVSFAHENGATGDDVAIYDYENGTITFKMLGKVTVHVESDSGSRLEAKNSYTFDINNGYNIYSFAEAHLIANRNNGYNGEEINFVVLEKPVDPEGNYEYGYSLVPPVALLADAEQTVAAIIGGVKVPEVIDRFTGSIVTNRNTNARIQFVNKSAWINGNNHSIDASQIRVFNKAEFDAWKANNPNSSAMPDISSILSVETWDPNGAAGSPLQKATFDAKLYNIIVKGNAPIDHNPGIGVDDQGNPTGLGFGKSGGATYIGLSIGSYEYNTHYTIDARNITISACEIGARVIGLVGNGTISDLYAYNCYSTGIAVKSSIVVLNNLKFGPCGACALELSPEECHQAGLNDNDVQQVTITGTIDTLANKNNANTTYFQNYSVQGATIPMIIQGNLSAHAQVPNRVEHIRNANGEYVFFSLLLNDLNTFAANESVINYPDGIINMKDIPMGGVNTTHKFVALDVYVELTGMGTVKIGTALFYNMNYQGK